MQQGAIQRPCSGKTEVFFGRAGERLAQREQREIEAKTLCNSCSAQDTCLAGALERREQYGIWGGTTVEERELIHEARRTAGWRIPDTEVS